MLCLYNKHFCCVNTTGTLIVDNKVLASHVIFIPKIIIGCRYLRRSTRTVFVIGICITLSKLPIIIGPMIQKTLFFLTFKRSRYYLETTLSNLSTLR